MWLWITFLTWRLDVLIVFGAAGAVSVLLTSFDTLLGAQTQDIASGMWATVICFAVARFAELPRKIAIPGTLGLVIAAVAVGRVPPSFLVCNSSNVEVVTLCKTILKEAGSTRTRLLVESAKFDHEDLRITHVSERLAKDATASFWSRVQVQNLLDKSATRITEQAGDLIMTTEALAWDPAAGAGMNTRFRTAVRLFRRASNGTREAVQALEIGNLPAGENFAIDSISDDKTDSDFLLRGDLKTADGATTLLGCKTLPNFNGSCYRDEAIANSMKPLFASGGTLVRLVVVKVESNWFMSFASYVPATQSKPTKATLN